MTTFVVIPGPSEARNPGSIITILEELFGCSSFA